LDEKDVFLNYQLNKRPEYRFNTRTNVTAAASSPSVIRKYHEFFSFTGYKTPSISLEAEGIRGIALSEEGNTIKDKTVAVMHIGNFLTNVIILKNGFLTASRIIPTADENFSRVLVGETIVDGKTVSVSLEEADIIKKDIGIPMGQTESSAYARVLPPSTITQMLQPLLEGFISKIERFFKFYKAESATDKIDEILLAGIGTNLKNIDTYFESNFKIPTRLFQIQTEKLFSFKIKDPKKEAIFIQNIKSFSSLLGSLVCIKETGNILKIYEAPGIWDKIAVSLKKLYTIFIGLIFLIGYVILLSRSIEMRNNANHLEEKWRNMMTTYHSFFTLQGQRANLNRTLLAYNDLKKSTTLPWLNIFQDISKRVPEKLVVWTLKVNDQLTPKGTKEKVLEMKGFVLDLDENQEEIITQFIVSLNQSKYFRNVDITYTEKDVMEPHLTHFEVKARIAKGKPKP